MIAYNRKWLYNVYVRKQADEALREQCITPETHDAIYKAKEVKFYTPNFFVKIGLAILTLVICSFTMGLIALMFSFHSPQVLLIFIGIVTYVAAEILINQKAHYNSGVDNMLVWLAAWFVCLGINWGMGWGPYEDSIFSFITFIICFVLAARFADTLLSIAATIALLCFVFFSYQHTGALAKATTPFVMMIVSAAIYFVSERAIKYPSLLLYRYCLRCVNVVALVALYASGNYYLVKELSNEMFHLGLRPQDSLPMGLFFWIWTLFVPFIYIGVGINNKNITLIRTGIPLVAVAVLTFRYYHAILAPEMALMLGGVLLFVVSYSLINYLRESKNGFTFKPENYTSDSHKVGQLITNEFINSAAAGAGGKQENSTWE